jgi:hypothetical protein
MDLDAGDSDRLFTFEVAKTNEQEEGAVSRPGFQVFLRFIEVEFISNLSKMKSCHISRYEVPTDPSLAVEPSMFVPRLLHGETTQAFWTATYIPHQTRWEKLEQYSLTRVHLEQLL